MLSYWLMYVSRPLLKQCRCLDILFLLGLYEQQNNHFFFLILISMNRHSVLSCNLYSVSKQEEISSLTYRSIPPPFAQRSKSPYSKICAEGNDSSIFVWDMSNISRCLLASDSRKWNSFLIKFMFNFHNRLIYIFLSHTFRISSKLFSFSMCFSSWPVLPDQLS